MNFKKRKKELTFAKHILGVLSASGHLKYELRELKPCTEVATETLHWCLSINLIFPFIMPTPLKGIGFMDCRMIKRIIILLISMSPDGRTVPLKFLTHTVHKFRTNSLLYSPTFQPWRPSPEEIFQLDRKAGLPLEGQQESRDAVSSLQSKGCAGRRLDNLVTFHFYETDVN